MKAYFESPIGILEIEEEKDLISAIRIIDTMPKQKSNEKSPLLEKAIKQLHEYFLCKRKSFELPTKQVGTEFQQKAWNYLISIPYGETASYKQEAEAIGSPKGFRAVGSANGKNKLLIVVPCHRVINEGGNLGGFAYDIEIKKYLLEMEKLSK